MKKSIITILFFLYFYCNLFCFKDINNKERFYELKHHISGINFGYNADFKNFSNNVFVGLSSSFSSRSEFYQLYIDLSYQRNITSKFNQFHISTKYNLFDYGTAIGLKSNFYFENKQVEYSPDLILAYEQGLFGFQFLYKIKQKNYQNSKFGISLILRPQFLLAWLNNP